MNMKRNITILTIISLFLPVLALAQGNIDQTNQTTSQVDQTNLLNQQHDSKSHNNPNVCYGFILRSVNDSITKTHSDLFIESSLMKYIRKTWYENNTIKQCHENKWNKTNPKKLNIKETANPNKEI